MSNSCIKCGSEDLNTQYIGDDEHITSSSNKKIKTEFLTSSESSYHWTVTSIKEHLHKHCKNCHYEWREDVLSPQEQSK